MISVQEAETCAGNLAAAEWHPYNSRPSGDAQGYFVILHWYRKEMTWVPLYLTYGDISSQLGKLYRGSENTPLSKYLSSFPQHARRFLWSKWLLDSSSAEVWCRLVYLLFWVNLVRFVNAAGVWLSWCICYGEICQCGRCLIVFVWLWWWDISMWQVCGCLGAVVMVRYVNVAGVWFICMSSR